MAPAAWLPCALDRRLASASVSSKAIIAILSKTRPIARMVLLPVRLFVRPMQKRGDGAAEQANELAPLHLDDPKDYAEYSRSAPCIAAKAGTLLSALGQKRKSSA